MEKVKLKLESVDFERNAISLVIPGHIFDNLEFYPCEIEVDLSPLERLHPLDTQENKGQSR